LHWIWDVNNFGSWKNPVIAVSFCPVDGIFASATTNLIELLFRLQRAGNSTGGLVEFQAGREIGCGKGDWPFAGGWNRAKHRRAGAHAKISGPLMSGAGGGRMTGRANAIWIVAAKSRTKP